MEIEKWRSIIEDILTDEANLIEIANKGQQEYKKVWSEQVKIKFCEKFIEMINPI